MPNYFSKNGTFFDGCGRMVYTVSGTGQLEDAGRARQKRGKDMTQTRRLYYENVYIKEFDAQVLECRPAKDGFHVLLDESAFYPEGGGQPSDVGSLGKIQVKEVQEKNGELLHYTDEPLTPGERVHGQIDWEHRFDLMQQHSGEHMVSGLVHEAFGYDNVGFHMGNDVITIDFNGPLTEKEMEAIEADVNEKIWKNIPVEITYPSPEELERLPYRSKKELTGRVRLVNFPETDLCACCGTHVTHTGEIGLVKLLSVVKFREGVRMEMLCGKRAMAYLNAMDGQNHRVSVKLSAKPGETAQAVERLYEENYRLKGRIMELEEAMFASEAKGCAGKGDVLLFYEGLEADSLRKLTDAVMQECGGRCAVFSRNEDGSYKYAMGEKDGDLRLFAKEMNNALDGRGGGKPFFVQGSVKANETEIRQFFEK